MSRRLALFLAAASLVWIAAILLVPLQSSGLIRAVVYATGALVCHQRPERSFHLAGTPLPVCARCAGLYLSGAAGCLAAWVGFPSVPRRARALLMAAAAPTAISVAGEAAHIFAGSNLVRAAAALPLGACAGWLFVRMLRAESPEYMRYDPLIYAHENHGRRGRAPRL
jgi:uncharacterized membrane protein